MVQAKNAIAAMTSRRNFITSSAAAVAIASAAPALAFPSGGPDAELIELGRQLEIIDVQYREASEVSTRIHRAMDTRYPALPDVLKARDADQRFNLPKPNDGKWYKPVDGGSMDQPGYYTTYHLNELKQHRSYQRKEIPIKDYRSGMFSTDVPLLLDGEMVVTVVPWPEAQARVNELIAAIEVWGKAVQKIRHASGWMRAEREFNRIGNKQSDIFDRIAEIDAKTLQGLRVKARAVKLIHFDDEQIEFGRCTDDVLAASILNDLLALQV